VIRRLLLALVLAGWCLVSAWAQQPVSVVNFPSLSSAHAVSAILTCADTSGSGTAQSCSTSPSFNPVTNDCIVYTTTTANSGTGLTLNVNSLGAKSIAKWQGPTTLTAGDVAANKPLLVCYDGTNWDLSTVGNAPGAKGSCTEAWGGSGTSFALVSGDDAISNNTCYNDSGVTRTVTAVKCLSDAASNTTTVNPTFGAAGTGTAILTGALTCGNSNAMSATGTLDTGSHIAWTTGTGIDPAMAGTLTGTHIAIIVDYTF
jgi:hypothetical protein